MIWYAGIRSARGENPTRLHAADRLEGWGAEQLRYAYRRLRRAGCDASTARVALSSAFFAGRSAAAS